MKDKSSSMLKGLCRSENRERPYSTIHRVDYNIIALYIFNLRKMCNYCVRLHLSSTGLEALKVDNGYTQGSILLTIVFLKSMMKYLYKRKESVGRKVRDWLVMLWPPETSTH